MQVKDALALSRVFYETSLNCVFVCADKGDETKYKGKKPSFSRGALTLVQDMLATGAGTTQIANAAKLTRQTVLRIKGDPEAAEAALVRWGL